jgi:cytochrome c oxidase subunit II
MTATSANAPHGSGPVAEKAEWKWAALVAVVIVFLLAMIAYTSLHWAMMPATRVETVDPTTLHLAGEFTEDNLGTATEQDGSVTVRMIAQQYSFTPQCLLIPADTPVTFRATSADALHGFIIAETNVNIMLEPGYISTFKTQFHIPGDHVMPCHEFCGVGHAGMWGRVKIVDKASFFKQPSDAKRVSCAGK